MSLLNVLTMSFTSLSYVCTANKKSFKIFQNLWKYLYGASCLQPIYSCSSHLFKNVLQVLLISAHNQVAFTWLSRWEISLQDYFHSRLAWRPYQHVLTYGADPHKIPTILHLTNCVGFSVVWLTCLCIHGGNWWSVARITDTTTGGGQNLRTSRVVDVFCPCFW